MKEGESKLVLTSKEAKVIELMRNIGYGEIKIVIQNHEPIRVEEITKSLKL